MGASELYPAYMVPTSPLAELDKYTYCNKIKISFLVPSLRKAEEKTQLLKEQLIHPHRLVGEANCLTYFFYL